MSSRPSNILLKVVAGIFLIIAVYILGSGLLQIRPNTQTKPNLENTPRQLED